MKMNHAFASLAGLAAIATTALASTIPAGTEVDLRFDQSVSSATAKIGDRIDLHVSRDVMVDGRVVSRSGTPAVGVISSVQHRDRFGKNAQLRIAIEPIHSMGRRIPVEARDRGKMLAGSRTDEAAVASGGGALILGPIGLVGGYFITGKQVHIKPGDHLRTEVSRSTWVG